MKRLLIAAASMLVTASAVAQEQVPQPAILYSKGRFEGAQLTIWGPWQHITPEFTARSIKVPEGQSWEFCSGNTFTGCKEINQSVTATVMTVRSARPAMRVVSAAASGVAPLAAPDKTLRGLTSEFFVAPRQGGSRITVQPATGEAMRQRANAFCVSKGWRQSVYARLQTAGGIYYLIDVLCADSAS